MRCILFNKTTPIFEMEYDSNSNHIDEIYIQFIILITLHYVFI